MKFDGIYIAPVTPVTPDGSLDARRFEELLSFLLAGGVDGFCIGGGTSEYVRFSSAERKELFSIASGMLPPGKRLFAAIGDASLDGVIELGTCAGRLGVDAVLLPPPHFFRYSQDDLAEFYRRASRKLDSPVLLYNLPFFTNPLDYETSARLLDEEDGIVGIKDSSGLEDRFGRYVNDFGNRDDKDVSLLVGQDPFAYDALHLGWDGIISGLGTLCPELLVCLFRSFRGGDPGRAEQCQRMIREMAVWLDPLPVPWAIRFGLECRGLDCGAPALPLSGEREKQKRAFQAWFEDWLEKNSSLWQNEG